MTLDPLMFRWFNRDSTLITDELAVYDWFGSKIRRRDRVNHSAGEYAREHDGVTAHVNTAESFFGLFKKGDRRHSSSGFAKASASLRCRAQLPLQPPSR